MPGNPSWCMTGPRKGPKKVPGMKLVYRYIHNKMEHDRKWRFAEKYEQFLIQCGIEFDRRFHLD